LDGGTLSIKHQWRGEKLLEVTQLLSEFTTLTRGRENHVLASSLLFTFEVALTGHARFIDGVTFFGHTIFYFCFIFFRVLFRTILFIYIDTCWYST